MNQQETKADETARCQVCGQELPPHVPASRCPHCLLRQGLPVDASDLQATLPVAPRANPNGALPQLGELFGHYRIMRLLGQGGMGAVFEAQDTESGRRIALKVLGHKLDSPEARGRFFREGRLAASVNHPNSVYVFGTEEIAGVPVIAMELVEGGTLQDRVSRQGPMPVREVVDSALQIISGLQAAQQVGVLHRDIKPSNCFVETNGTVKIGDFGLSISTLVRTEPSITTTGAFLGTPAFSSPEQLRGDELTVRSDIYSVGVTLHFLLTGRHPFQAPDMIRLLATVLENRAESPAKWRPDLPAGLCRVVLRCLEKDPERRFRNYDELRNALMPYASDTSTPATLGLRAAAYVLDALLLAVPVSLLNMVVNLVLYGAGHVPGIKLAEAFMVHLTPHDAPALLVHNVCGIVFTLSYYAVLEGLWGASVGKFICRLRVARLDHTVPGIPRAFLRTLIITAAPTVIWLLAWNVAHTCASGSSAGLWLAGLGLITLPTRLALFVTARQRNGFAGIHDLISATRVTLKPAYPARPVLTRTTVAAPDVKTLPLVGPYHVLDRIGSEDGAELLLGFDPRLLRRVWIRKLLPGAPTVPAGLRHLNRPGRLRWLTAQRSDTEAWDAYEAPSGQALLTLIHEPQGWNFVRYWLLDLTKELVAATKDAALPAALGLDRVWVTGDGRAKLLDFPAPGIPDLRQGASSAAESSAPTPHAFLRLVAISSLNGLKSASQSGQTVPLGPLALHALTFLETLDFSNDLSQVLLTLQSLLSLPPLVSRTRRALLLTGTLVFPFLVAVLAGGFGAFQRSVLNAAPELATLNECLVHHHELQREVTSGKLARKDDLDAFEIYISGRFGSLITNQTRWNNPVAQTVIAAPLRIEAEQIVNRVGCPEGAQLTDASRAVEKFFRKPPDIAAREALQQPNLLLGALAVCYGTTLIVVVIPCLVGSLLFRGGALTHLLGIVFVTGNGRPASRWRVAGRNLVAWLPFLMLPLAANTDLAFPLLLCLSSALAAVSVGLPARGLADRLAGTWPVPR